MDLFFKRFKLFVIFVFVGDFVVIREFNKLKLLLILVLVFLFVIEFVFELNLLKFVCWVGIGDFF